MIEALTNILNQGLAYIVPMTILLGLLIFVHELGHFLAAKFFKVRVETFSLGFGPKILKFKKGDTVYCVSALPLGGYVKMFGDEPGKDIPDAQKNSSYLHKPVGQRIIIALAGPLMNLFFAGVLFFTLAEIGDKAISPVVGEIAPNSKAFEIGFKPYDSITKINQTEISHWTEVKDIIENSANTPLHFVVDRRGETVSIDVTPEKVENDNIFSTASTMGSIDGLSPNLHMPIVGVHFNGPLYKAGVRNGDHILKVDEQEVQWYKDLEPMIFESLFSGSGKTTLRIKRFKDFRKHTEAEEFNLELVGQNFQDHNLGIFIPEMVIAEVQEDSPAFVAGLQRLDVIKTINGNPIYSFQDIVKNVSSFEKEKGPLKIEVIRDDQTQTFEMTPKMNSLEGEYGAKENRFTIGVVPVFFAIPQTFTWKSPNAGHALARAWDQTWHWSKVTVLSFVRIIQNKISSKNISGIISIGQVAQQSWSIGLSAFLKMMAIISINLFIINLLPIPILDGGHLVIFTLEAIKGSPLSLKKIEMAQQIGFLIILFLMAFALFNDFSRIFGS